MSLKRGIKRGSRKLYYWQGKVFSALRQASTMALSEWRYREAMLADGKFILWQYQFCPRSALFSLSSFFTVDLNQLKNVISTFLKRILFLKYRTSMWNIYFHPHKQLLILSCASNSRVNRDFFQNIEHQKRHLIKAAASTTFVSWWWAAGTLNNFFSLIFHLIQFFSFEIPTMHFSI